MKNVTLIRLLVFIGLENIGLNPKREPRANK